LASHPQNVPFDKTPIETIDKILIYRKKTGHGARLIKFVLGLNESEKTIIKILNANGYIIKKEPKPRKKTDMTQYRESIDLLGFSKSILSTYVIYPR